MVIEEKKVVGLTFELRIKGNEDEVFQAVGEDNPMYFLYGAGNVIPGFEKGLKGKKKGEDYKFELSPDEAYGSYDPNKIIEAPIEGFMVDGKLADVVKVDEFLMLTDQEGRPMEGKVVGITDKAVKMDLNPRLAGKSLVFSGKVLEVRDAEKAELEHGHVHGPGGHQH